MNEYSCKSSVYLQAIRNGPMARIPRSQRGGPGSIPGWEAIFAPQSPSRLDQLYFLLNQAFRVVGQANFICR